MAYNKIVLKGNGHFIEGELASGQTPKPGQCISLKSDGKYEAWNGAADGERDEVIVLCENPNLGYLPTEAYADGSRFQAYIPVPGDELQVLVASGENIAIGDKLIIDDGTGKCIETTGSPEMEPFKALASSGGALGADGLIRVRFTGH